jgi:hypothetical protein
MRELSRRSLRSSGLRLIGWSRSPIHNPSRRRHRQKHPCGMVRHRQRTKARNRLILAMVESNGTAAKLRGFGLALVLPQTFCAKAACLQFAARLVARVNVGRAAKPAIRPQVLRCIGISQRSARSAAAARAAKPRVTVSRGNRIRRAAMAARRALALNPCNAGLFDCSQAPKACAVTASAAIPPQRA